MKGKLICFIGIDGAGKSTLANATVQCLRDQGIRAVGVYGKTLPVVSRVLMAAGRMVFLRKQDIWQDYSNYAKQKKNVMTNPLLAYFYEAAVWLDYFPQAFFKVVIPLAFGVTIVCDRYLFDVVIGDLAVHSNNNERCIWRSLDIGFCILPKPDQVFFIDLPEQVAIRRKNDIPHVEYLRERRHLYQRLEERYPMSKLDGQEKLDDLVKQIALKIGMLQ